MLTERQAIKEELEWIRVERTRLSDRYWENMARLRELDELDRKNGPLVLIDHEKITGQLCDAVTTLRGLIPDISLDRIKEMMEQEVLRKTAEMFEEETIIVESSTVTQTNSEKSVTTKKVKRNDFKKQAPTVASILKEFGRPTSLQNIMAKLEEEHHIKWDYPTSSFDLIMQYDPHISRVSKGFYQYTI